MANGKWRMANYVLRLTFCALLLLLGGCAARLEAEAYDAVAGWLDARALPSERVAGPGTLAQRFTERPTIALPEDIDATALLTTLYVKLPDYVIPWPGVAWDGVLAHPWYQEHYRFLDTLSVSGDGLTPLCIYGYTPSPFDLGEWRPVEQPLGGTELELYAVRVNRQRLIPGDPLYITLSWRGDLFALPDAQRLVLRLMDAEGDGLRAQVEDVMVNGLQVDLHRAVDETTSRYTLTVSDDLPYGDYVLTLTLYRRNGATVGGENLRLVTLSRPLEVTRERPMREVSGAWVLDDMMVLIGYDASQYLAPGETLRIALYWFALADIPDDYTVFVHLLDANGAAVAQADGKPVWWTYPTTQWEPGQYIRDEHILELAADTPRGDYTLAVGMYDAETGVRLNVKDVQGTVPDGRIELCVVRVR